MVLLLFIAMPPSENVAMECRTPEDIQQALEVVMRKVRMAGDWPEMKQLTTTIMALQNSQQRGSWLCVTAVASS